MNVLWGAFLAFIKEKINRRKEKETKQLLCQEYRNHHISPATFCLRGSFFVIKRTIKESDSWRWFGSFWVIQELKLCVYLKARKLIAFYSTELMTKIVKEIKKKQLYHLVLSFIPPSTILTFLFSPSSNTEWVPSTVLGAADKMVSGADFFSVFIEPQFHGEDIWVKRKL